jgi:hypothetical protein
MERVAARGRPLSGVAFEHLKGCAAIHAEESQRGAGGAVDHAPGGILRPGAGGGVFINRNARLYWSEDMRSISY